eukprot:GHVR01078551.1.p1 GENE.GHVR01078551.1~~GHVR01078551.1.p1  ORF type:complete len:135 (+),score=22.21 GHVR01078551.1:122-526(+)
MAVQTTPLLLRRCVCVWNVLSADRVSPASSYKSLLCKHPSVLVYEYASGILLTRNEMKEVDKMFSANRTMIIDVIDKKMITKVGELHCTASLSENCRVQRRYPDHDAYMAGALFAARYSNSTFMPGIGGASGRT